MKRLDGSYKSSLPPAWNWADIFEFREDRVFQKSVKLDSPADTLIWSRLYDSLNIPFSQLRYLVGGTLE